MANALVKVAPLALPVVLEETCSVIGQLTRALGLPREVLASDTWQQTLQGLPGYGGGRAGQVLSLTQALPWWRFRARKPQRNRR